MGAPPAAAPGVCDVEVVVVVVVVNGSALTRVRAVSSLDDGNEPW
jgi:hypothetical protein